jgi:hypothetical protein
VTRIARQRAQSTIEFVLALPSVLVGLMILVSIGLVTRADGAVASVAAEAARAGALASNPAEAGAAARNRALEVGSGFDLDPDRLETWPDTSNFGRGGEVRVRVDYTLVLADLPLVGWGSVGLHHEAAEPVDAYRALR